MLFPQLPKYDPYEEENDRAKTSRNSTRGLLDNPLSLPVWMWNIIVVNIYIWVTLLILRVIAALIIGLLGLVFS